MEKALHRRVSQHNMHNISTRKCVTRVIPASCSRDASACIYQWRNEVTIKTCHNCQVVHHIKIAEGIIVRETLHVVRLQIARVVDHVVVRRRDGALAHRLRHQEEIVPIRWELFAIISTLNYRYKYLLGTELNVSLTKRWLCIYQAPFDTRVINAIRVPIII